MENYTEKKLKPMNKTQLLDIAAANGIEVADGTKNDDIIALILAKGCPMPEVTQGTSQDNVSGNGDENSSNPPPDDIEDDSVPKFSKEQLLKSIWYSHRRDALAALLDDAKTYSHAAVDKLIESFMKGRVK